MSEADKAKISRAVRGLSKGRTPVPEQPEESQARDKGAWGGDDRPPWQYNPNAQREEEDGQDSWLFQRGSRTQGGRQIRADDDDQGGGATNWWGGGGGGQRQFQRPAEDEDGGLFTKKSQMSQDDGLFERRSGTEPASARGDAAGGWGREGSDIPFKRSRGEDFAGGGDPFFQRRGDRPFTDGPRQHPHDEVQGPPQGQPWQRQQQERPGFGEERWRNEGGPGGFHGGERWEGERHMDGPFREENRPFGRREPHEGPFGGERREFGGGRLFADGPPRPFGERRRPFGEDGEEPRPPLEEPQPRLPGGDRGWLGEEVRPPRGGPRPLGADREPLCFDSVLERLGREEKEQKSREGDGTWNQDDSRMDRDFGSAKRSPPRKQDDRLQAFAKLLDADRRRENEEERRRQGEGTSDTTDKDRKEAPSSSAAASSSQGQVGEMVQISDLLEPPGRYIRPPKIVVIFRGLPGAGKSHVAKLVKSKEAELGSDAPRILSLDDYFECDGQVCKKEEKLFDN